jgi:hypothetical protein
VNEGIKIAATALALAALGGCGGGNASSPAASTTSVTSTTSAASCIAVTTWVKKQIDSGVPGTISGPMSAVRSDYPFYPWFMAARLPTGTAVWGTTFEPSMTSFGSGANVQAINEAAWQGSEWGVIGAMEDHYPSGAPPLDDPAIQDAAACVDQGG